jgi:hypothetical protein
MSLFGSIAGAVAGKAISSLLGGGKKSGGNGQQGPFRVVVPGGFRTDIMNGAVRAYDDPERVALLSKLKSSYLDQAGQISSIYAPQASSAYAGGIQSLNDQIGEVKPGYGALTQAAVDSITNAGNKAGSDLRSNLAKRRVLGSSFADAAEAQQKLDVGQQLNAAKAASFLSELDATNKLTTQKLQLQMASLDSLKSLSDEAFGLKNASTQVDLDEQNRLGQLAQGLISGAQQQAADNARLKAQIDAQNAAGSGSFAAGVGNSVSGGLSDFLSGLGKNSGFTDAGWQSWLASH